MSKVKYYYDHDTLSYREIKVTNKNRISAALLFLLASFFFGITSLLILLNSDIINTPSEVAQKRSIENFNLQMPGASVTVPLVLVKAVGNKADEKDDDLASMIGNVIKWKAYLNRNSVQEWIIEIKTPKDTAKLKMTIRSDSGVRADKAPGKQGRLGKYTQLKLQYSGLI